MICNVVSEFCLRRVVHCALKASTYIFMNNSVEVKKQPI